MSTTLLSPTEIAAALSVRDLTDPHTGPHAIQLLVDVAAQALSDAWGCAVRVIRRRPIVSVEDNYELLGYPAATVTRDARYTRYVSETCLLRSHTSAGMPPALRELGRQGDEAPADLLLVLPGICYRRDVVDRLHTGTPHQLDLWRIARDRRLGEDDLTEMIEILGDAMLPGMVRRDVASRHPYTERGRQVDVWSGGWVEVAECGLAAKPILQVAGLDPDRWSGLALGMGLDRVLMLRKGIPDIRLLRSANPRVVAQMRDLRPYRPVSDLPTVRRDLSVAVSEPVDAEILGDRVRDALGPQADLLERVEVLDETAYADLPDQARERLGIRSGQVNVLVRLVVRPLDRTLTADDANAIRDRVYERIHEGGRLLPESEAASSLPDGGAQPHEVSRANPKTHGRTAPVDGEGDAIRGIDIGKEVVDGHSGKG